MPVNVEYSLLICRGNMHVPPQQSVRQDLGYRPHAQEV